MLYELAQCFRLRALNHASEDSDTVWDEYGVALILKKVAPYIPMEIFGLSQYFAFREKHQGAKCIFVLRMLIEKSLLFRR